MTRKFKRKQVAVKEELEEKDLDRFAGSSDEEDAQEQEEQMAPAALSTYDDQHDADVENDTDDESEDEERISKNTRNEDDEQSIDSTSSIEEEVVDPASKMANAMGRILGGLQKSKESGDRLKSSTTSVVLGKTVTPLQKLQQQEKDKLKVLKEKRQAKKERNLSALHYPLSIATSNSVQTEGRLSVAKELEQERFHRRVATRGVVALFNAISQHQRNDVHDASSSSATKKQEVSKMTKHSFLDKIKSTAKSKSVSQVGEDKKRKISEERGDDNSRGNRSSPSWSALKDDYMLNPKKNWDEESSDEEGLQTEIAEESNADEIQQELPKKKQRASQRQQ